MKITKKQLEIGREFLPQFTALLKKAFGGNTVVDEMIEEDVERLTKKIEQSLEVDDDKSVD